MTTYNISITSDIICPWCYIGHTRLSHAITTHKSKFPQDTFNLKYIPFYLNPPQHTLSGGPIPPSFPVQSRPRREMYLEKFGAERAKQMESTMTQVSAAEGLSFKFGGMSGPSRNGHRLVHYAQGRGEKAQNDVMLGLWRRYFEREVDVTRLDVLVEVGVEAGLGDESEVWRFLESGEGGEEVDALAMEAREGPISGVPFYVVQDLWGVSGAQEPRTFEMLFQRWKQMEADGKVGSVKNGDGKGEEVKNGNGCL